MTNLLDWNERYDYAQKIERRGPMKPTADHLTLLAQSSWDWNDAEFGAASMHPKKTYGNGNVEDDLAELLPHLTVEDRIKRHCELPAVLAYISAKAKDVEW